jgi:hypothetical protein
MEPIMFLILSISVIGIVVFLGLSQYKIENNVPGHFNEGNQDFDSFMTKVKGNYSKIRC